MSQTLQAIRSKYPQYKDVPDGELVSSIGKKYPSYLDSDKEFRSEFDNVTSPVTPNFSVSRPLEPFPVSDDFRAETQRIQSDPSTSALVDQFSKASPQEREELLGPTAGQAPFEPYFPLPRADADSSIPKWAARALLPYMVPGAGPALAETETARKIAAGVVNTGTKLAESIESPAGPATLLLGSAPSWVSKLAGLGFGLNMAPAAGEALGHASVTKDPQDITEAIGDTALTVLPSLGPAAFGRRAAEPGKFRIDVNKSELARQAEPSKSELPSMNPDERLVTVQKPDGTTYQAAFSDKFYEHPSNGKVPSVARLVGEPGEQGWSHGMLAPGEKILPEVEPTRGGTTDTPPTTLRVEGESEAMRKSAARATTSESVPEPVQERIAQAPESFYKVQPMKAVEETVAGMADADLAAVPEASNIHVASKLELSKRLFDAGKLDEGYEVFKQVSKTGTDFGQNINQFKFLKGQNPINVVHIINQGLKESGRDPLTKVQAEKVAKTAKESIDANKSLDKAKDEWMKNPSEENAAKADEAMKRANERDLETQREMAKYKVKTWPGMLKAFAQGNPLTPISQVANIVGNSLGAGMEAGSRTLAAQMDIIRSALTGGERKVSVQPVAGTVEAAKGFGRGLAKAPGIMARGSGDVIKGETRAQLQPLRSLQKAFAKNPDVPTVGGKVPFNERARMAVEGVFGIAPEVMLRMLAAADKPAYESARSRLIAEQLKLEKVSKDKWPMAQKFPELFFEPDTLKRIKQESAEAVFQKPSKAVNYLESWIKDRKGGEWADLAFTLMVAPYRLTPWNLVGRTLIYNPLIAALRTGLDAAKGNTRAAEINAGRMIVGSMLYTAGYFLYKNGLVGPSLDERDETQKARLLSKEVLPPNHVNIDGLRRLMDGGDAGYKAGDETWDLTRGGGAAGAILSSVANIGRDFEKKPETSESEFVASLIKNSTLEQASFTVNQSFLKGVTGIMDAVRNRNIDPYMNGVENMLLNVGTPNTLSTLSRATRKYVPDVSGDTMRKDFENVVRNRFGVAGLDDYLPLKRDLWGKPMLQTPEGRNAILYHLFDISKGQQVTDDPVALELYQLWRETSDTRAIPSIPAKQITFGADTYVLKPEQYARYAELVGKYRRQIAEMLVTNPNWQNVDSENKIKLLDSVYDKGADIGKALLLKESLGDMKPKPKKAGFTPVK